MKKNEMKTILSTNSYGSVILNLKKVLDEKGIKRYTLARQIDTRFEVIDKWYEGEIVKMDLDILARICYVLGCDVSELLEYKNDRNA